MLPKFSYTLLLRDNADPIVLQVLAGALWPNASHDFVGPAVVASGTHSGKAILINAPYVPGFGSIRASLENDTAKAEALGHRAHIIVWDEGAATKEARMQAFARLSFAAKLLGARWAFGGPGNGTLLPIGRYADTGPLAVLGAIAKAGGPLPPEAGGGKVLVTMGLSIFLGYEIGFPAKDGPEAVGLMTDLQKMAFGALNTALWKDGDTVGMENGSIRYIRAWKEPQTGLQIMLMDPAPRKKESLLSRWMQRR